MQKQDFTLYLYHVTAFVSLVKNATCMNAHTAQTTEIDQVFFYTVVLLPLTDLSDV